VAFQPEFTGITSVRELKDARVLVTDGREQRLLVVDARSSKAEEIGRKGAGPGEYQTVGRLFALGGDSTLLTDISLRRWLILEGARIVATLPPDQPAIRATQGAILGADANGHVLSLQYPLPPSGVTSYTEKDSLKLVRTTISTGRSDTVAAVRRNPSTTEVERDAEGRTVRSMSSAMPYRPGEKATVFTDGWLAIARLDPYRVDWRSPDGRWIRGAPLPVPVVKFDAREKRAYLDRNAGNPSQLAAAKATVDALPATVPPFSSGDLFASKDGKLLIERTRTADHPERRIDVIDRRGTLAATVTIGERERIVGFGARSVYVARKDDDDIEHLDRHPWPAAP
jgi:hypothetical protein